jgi:hypothetical protein
MQTSARVRAVIAAVCIALVAVALVGATWHSGGAQVPATAVVGVPTGEFVHGVPVHRLPAITVTAPRSRETARHPEGQR